MYKLPMFGCTDPSQVLTEIANCTKSFPDAYIRLVAFDQVCDRLLWSWHPRCSVVLVTVTSRCTTPLTPRASDSMH